MDQSHSFPLADLPPGTAKPLCIAGQPVLLVNHGGAIHAVANECSHAFQTLESGRVMNGWIACPAHGARFDLATGEALGPPATAPIATFPVRVADGLIYVDV